MTVKTTFKAYRVLENTVYVEEIQLLIREQFVKGVAFLGKLRYRTGCSLHTSGISTDLPPRIRRDARFLAGGTLYFCTLPQARFPFRTGRHIKLAVI